MKKTSGTYTYTMLPVSMLKRRGRAPRRPNTPEEGERVWRMLELRAEELAAIRRAGRSTLRYQIAAALVAVLALVFGMGK